MLKTFKTIRNVRRGLIVPTVLTVILWLIRT